MPVQPERTSLGELKLVGIAVRTTNDAEMNPDTAKIPANWQRFWQEDLSAKIPNAVEPNIVYGSYSDYESDYTGEFIQVVGVQVSSLDEIPDGMVAVNIPTQDYLVFPARGEMPQIIGETWGAIWQYFSENKAFQRAYTADFEKYHPDGSGADIYIAIK
jgi:predicted transcriptional regulator YdeE